jgi:trigger factor
MRKTIFQEREIQAQHEAKEKILDQLVEAHEFPIPEAFLDRQIENQLENQLRPSDRARPWIRAS